MSILRTYPTPDCRCGNEAPWMVCLVVRRHGRTTRPALTVVCDEHKGQYATPRYELVQRQPVPAMTPEGEPR